MGGTRRAALRRAGAAHRALKEAACWANGRGPFPGPGPGLLDPVADVLGFSRS